MITFKWKHMGYMDKQKINCTVLEIVIVPEVDFRLTNDRPLECHKVSEVNLIDTIKFI